MTEPPADWSAPSGPPGYHAPPTPWYAAPAPPQPGVVPLRPLAVGELLDGAIKVIRRYPRPTLGLSAAIALVVTAINVGLALSLDSATLSFDDPNLTGEDFANALGGSLTLTLLSGGVSYLAGLVLTGTLIAVIGNAVQGKPAPMDQVWAKVRPRILSLLGLSLLTGLLVAGPVAIAVALAVVLAVSGSTSTLFLTVPLALAALGLGVYVYVRLSMAPACLVLEKVGVTDAMRRSGVLVRGSWWRVFGITVLAAIIAGVIGAIIGTPISIIALLLGGTDGGTGFLIAQQVGSGLASVLVAPFGSGVAALLYVDRRMRAEGLDVALQAATGKGPAL